MVRSIGGGSRMLHTHTKEGRLTAYAFACGHVETFGEVTIEGQHGAYHVRRSCSHRLGSRWLSFDSIREARLVARDWTIQAWDLPG